MPIEQVRNGLTFEHDVKARERDARAEQRDLEADALARRALELDDRDAIADRHTLSVQDLRGRGAEHRRRAALDREHAARDREGARLDRREAARDRDRARRERERAGTDELTGARRRGVGLEELQREIDRIRRLNGTLLLAYVDVDGLKAVNDEHGHAAGDRLLCDVAGGLSRCIRPYDLVVRIGGDEFVCVLPDMRMDDARRRLDQVRAGLPQEMFTESFSVGISELLEGDSLRELINRADDDLLASRNGSTT